MSVVKLFIWVLDPIVVAVVGSVWIRRDRNPGSQWKVNMRYATRFELMDTVAASGHRVKDELKS